MFYPHVFLFLIWFSSIFLFARILGIITWLGVGPTTMDGMGCNCKTPQYYLPIYTLLETHNKYSSNCAITDRVHCSAAVYIVEKRLI
ncbi:MAG: hypothetical protein NXY57DRAFT_604992 [Lentinula lateritia]|nr:MAG: hypothetical protein NXY57DRAFT_604992 [Lentinula lateritia]